MLLQKRSRWIIWFGFMSHLHPETGDIANLSHCSPSGDLPSIAIVPYQGQLNPNGKLGHWNEMKWKRSPIAWQVSSLYIEGKKRKTSSWYWYGLEAIFKSATRQISKVYRQAPNRNSKTALSKDSMNHHILCMINRELDSSLNRLLFQQGKHYGQSCKFELKLSSFPICLSGCAPEFQPFR